MSSLFGKISRDEGAHLARRRKAPRRQERIVLCIEQQKRHAHVGVVRGQLARREPVLAEVKAQFSEKVNREAMLEKISYTVGSGYSPFIRAVPLMLKIPALRLIFMQSARSSSLTPICANQSASLSATRLRLSA